MLILICAKYYVLETKCIGDMTKFSELPEQPSYILVLGLNCFLAAKKNMSTMSLLAAKVSKSKSCINFTSFD